MRGRQAGTGEVPWGCIASSCTSEFWLVSTRHFHFLNNTFSVGWRLAEHLEICVAEEWKEQTLMTLDVKQTFMKNLCNTLLLNEMLLDSGLWNWQRCSILRPFFFISPTLMQYIQLKLKFKWEVLLPSEDNANSNRFNFHWNQELVVYLLLHKSLKNYRQIWRCISKSEESLWCFSSQR